MSRIASQPSRITLVRWFDGQVNGPDDIFFHVFPLCNHCSFKWLQRPGSLTGSLLPGVIHGWVLAPASKLGFGATLGPVAGFPGLAFLDLMQRFAELARQHGLVVAFVVELYCARDGSLRILQPEPPSGIQSCPICGNPVRTMDLRGRVATSRPLAGHQRWYGAAPVRHLLGDYPEEVPAERSSPPVEAFTAPVSEQDRAILADLARIQHSYEEIAAKRGCSIDHVMRLDRFAARYADAPAQIGRTVAPAPHMAQAPQPKWNTFERRILRQLERGSHASSIARRQSCSVAFVLSVAKRAGLNR